MMRIPYLFTLLVFSMPMMAGDYWKVMFDKFKEKEFKGRTKYESGIVVEGRECLRAEANGTASGLFLEQDVDLTRTPWLAWSWVAVDRHKEHDEKTKKGDDFVLRIYVVKKGGLAFWSTRALNYVFSSNREIGEHWGNPYTGNAHMVVVANNKSAKGWQNHARNIREDFKTYFNEDVDEIHSVAIMTDADNTGERVSGCYGFINWVANPE